jgi:endonuclease YncB( thermonuclease family)/thiol-disulfide isomerase/thioredoxin
MKIFLILLFVSSLLFPASPMVMRGIVSEVRDGRSIVVTSNGRKLTVFLKGVDAPDLNQEFGDISRQHLASLLLNQQVEVDFSELRTDHVLGKVIMNQTDIGLQVIRDGAAWFDKTNANNLAEVDRAVYAAAEEAARSEMRGLWQDGSPMPPWEWRRIQAAKQAIPVSYKKNSGRALETEDLVFAGRQLTGNTAGTKGGVPLPKPTAKPFNSPGQDADFRGYLHAGRVTIVYFYADWCPACRRITPLMEMLNAKDPNTQVVFMDISDWSSPVTQQYGVTSVPHLKVYDKNGNLAAEGRDARDWLSRAFSN